MHRNTGYQIFKNMYTWSLEFSFGFTVFFMKTSALRIHQQGVHPLNESPKTPPQRPSFFSPTYYKNHRHGEVQQGRLHEVAVLPKAEMFRF